LIYHHCSTVGLVSAITAKPLWHKGCPSACPLTCARLHAMGHRTGVNALLPLLCPALSVHLPPCNILQGRGCRFLLCPAWITMARACISKIKCGCPLCGSSHQIRAAVMLWVSDDWNAVATVQAIDSYPHQSSGSTWSCLAWVLPNMPYHKESHSPLPTCSHTNDMRHPCPQCAPRPLFELMCRWLCCGWDAHNTTLLCHCWSATSRSWTAYLPSCCHPS